VYIIRPYLTKIGDLLCGISRKDNVYPAVPERETKTKKRSVR
jgi:hypothetical protein